MGRGFAWYQMPEDEVNLFAFVAKRCDLVVTPFNNARGPLDVVEVAPSEYLASQVTFGCAICTRGTLQRCGVAAYGVPGDISYGLPLSAEKVSYRRAGIIDCHLGLCNLSANWEYLSEDKTALIDKSPEFKKWAAKIFDWARRHAPERLEYSGYSYPATVRAADAFRRGEFKTML